MNQSIIPKLSGPFTFKLTTLKDYQVSICEIFVIQLVYPGHGHIVLFQSVISGLSLIQFFFFSL